MSRPVAPRIPGALQIRSALRRHPVLSSIAMGATAAAALYGDAVGSPFVWIYVPVTLVLVMFVAIVDTKVRFRTPVLVALLVAALGNLAGGVLLVGGDVLYAYPWPSEAFPYDRLLHLYATGAATAACLDALRAWTGRALAPRGGVAFALVLMGSGLGSIVEVVEFIGTRIFENTNVGDYENTAWDLVANLLGAVVAVIVLARVERRASTRFRP